MQLIIKHAILEYLNSTQRSHTNNDITKKCVNRYPYFKKASVISIISSMGREGLLDRSNRGVKSYKINDQGRKLLDELTEAYNSPSEFGPYARNDETLFNKLTDPEALAAILNSIQKADMGVSVGEIITNMNLSMKHVKGIQRKLNYLHLSALITKKWNGNLFIYSISSNDNEKPKANESHIVEKTVDTIEKTVDTIETILNYVIDSHKWIGAKEVTAHLGLPKSSSYDIELTLQSLHNRGYLMKFQTKANKPVVYYNKGNFKYKVEDSDYDLKVIIAELKGLGVTDSTIDTICLNALESLLKDTLNERREREMEYLKEKRESELEYLKEKKFIFLEDFEFMKKQITFLEQELSNRVT